MFEEKNFLACNKNYEEADIVLLGLPFDGTTSFRPGTRFAPDAIRKSSVGLESYSPYLDKDLSETIVCDTGDLELPFGDTNFALSTISQTALKMLSEDKKIFSVGGEHLVTLPIVEAYKKKFTELVVIQLDAHADLRRDYLGVRLSHACVIRLILQTVSGDQIYQFGIRSGEKEEFAFGKKTTHFFPFNLNNFKTEIDKISNDAPIYLTVDLDILDPSIFCGTGTPEPGGISFDELISNLHYLNGKNLVGADVVELAPDYDSSGVSSITAAKVVREILLMM